MRFIWHWFTKAGISRQENQDCAGVAQWGDSLFAIVADGVSSHPKSGDLACAFTQHLVDLVITSTHPLASTDVVNYIKNAFEKLKDSHYQGASVAFIAAYFSADKLIYTIHAGDCRIGLRLDETKINWKTEVHSLANAIAPLEEESLRAHPARNQLTRSFRTKRYTDPEITTLACDYIGGAALATDGFWAGLPSQDQHAACKYDWIGPHDNEDDVSRLVIRWETSSQTWPEASSRLYVQRR